MQESVEVPDPPEMLEEDNVHERLVELEVTERATVPAKLFTGVIVMVDVPAVPVLEVTVVGLAEIAKSPAPITVKATVAELEREPLVAVTVTVKEPVVAAVQERVEVPVVVVPRARLVGSSVQVRPADGETVSVNATVPVKPFIATTVMVEVPTDPTVTLTELGVAVNSRWGPVVTV